MYSFKVNALLEELLPKVHFNVLKFQKPDTRIESNGWPINPKIITQMLMIGNLKCSQPLTRHQGTTTKLWERSQDMPLGKPREHGKESEQSKTPSSKFKEKRSDRDMVVFGHTLSTSK